MTNTVTLTRDGNWISFTTVCGSGFATDSDGRELSIDEAREEIATHLRCGWWVLETN